MCLFKSSHFLFSNIFDQWLLGSIVKVTGSLCILKCVCVCAHARACFI